MLKIRKSAERGHANHGWLDSQHTFSFADYYDPKHMSFSALRVINEDKIDGGAGFPMHTHRDMEIISYVIDGALEHKDSMGNVAVMKPGEIQKMSAGTGVTHSEYNHFKDKKAHFLQIWIMPDKTGYAPSYDQKSFDSHFACSDFVLVASGSGKENSIKLHQDVDIFVGKTKSDAEILHKTFPNRKTWVQIVKGNLTINGSAAESGDGVAISEVEQIEIKAKPGSEFLLFDLP